jgi:DNA helicase HerA-like ATPase
MTATSDLLVGTNFTSPSEPASLNALRFNRHTFWCGQSGSGKTYALGVVLEQLLAHSDLPIVIFDPNADFVRLNELRADAPTQDSALLADRDIRVLRPQGMGADALRVRFWELSLHAKAALLRIDPLDDRDEYTSLLHLDDDFKTLAQQGILAQLYASADPIHHRLAQRIENLQVLEWNIWAGPLTPVQEVIAERPNATVLDLGGFKHAEESLVIALAVLDDLWERREERRPVLLVIDEAHNLCSPDLETPLARAVREQLVRIAAEGRKYGLWLLLSTQRPSKVHPGIISQCDNLGLMKMTSPLDLAELGSLFGYAPAEMLALAPGFRQGQALFAGGFVAAPIIAQMGQRLTPEGGLDVKVPLRAK